VLFAAYIAAFAKALENLAYYSLSLIN